MCLTCSFVPAFSPKRIFLYNRALRSRTALSCILLFSLLSLKAQLSDTVPVKTHSPKLAAALSAVLPGAGQVYNRKYWKVPIVYGAFAATGYFFVYHQGKYKSYKNAYIIRTDNDPKTIDEYEGKYSDDNLLTLIDFYNRRRDLWVIGTAAVYVLNIIDAAVDAHLFTFDVSDNLSLHIHPLLNSSTFAGEDYKGMALIFKLN